MRSSVPLWERSALRTASGDTLRPGGFALTDRAAEAIGMVPGWRVLDVGAGLGATVHRLRSRFGAFAWGVEPSLHQIGRGEVSGLVAAQGTMLPFCSGSFDALFCECVFSLFEEPGAGLDEFARVLKEDGFFVLSDMYSPDEGGADTMSCATRARSFEATRDLLDRHGFSIVSVEDHSGYLKELAARMLWVDDDMIQDTACGCGRRLGYFLLIAQKRERNDVR